MSSISAGTTTTTGYVVTSDDSGALVLKTGPNNAVAATLDVNQNVLFPGSISSVNTFGFKNRIINGAMGIWQRGTSFQPNSVVFGADRFASYKAGAAAGDYAQSSDTPSGQGFTYSAYLNNADLRHSIELPGAGLPGEYVVGSTWTLSFWVKGASAGSSTMSIGWSNGVSASTLNNWGGTTPAFNFTTSWTKVTQTFTVTGTPTGTQPAILVYISSMGVGSYITGVQLEKGSTATSFDYRPYGTELALCQRYYWQINGASGQMTPISVNWYGTKARPCFPTPVNMRAGPTIALSGATAGAFFSTNNDSTYINFTYLGGFAEVNSNGITTCQLTLTPDAAGPGGGQLYIQNTRLLSVSAEL